MMPRDWFTLALRVLGVLQLIDAVEYFATSIAVRADLYRTTAASLGWFITATLVHFALAVWLLKYAPKTARLFYPD